MQDQQSGLLFCYCKRLIVGVENLADDSRKSDLNSGELCNGIAEKYWMSNFIVVAMPIALIGFTWVSKKIL
jgi:hypothetical protein